MLGAIIDKVKGNFGISTNEGHDAPEETIKDNFPEQTNKYKIDESSNDLTLNKYDTDYTAIDSITSDTVPEQAKSTVGGESSWETRIYSIFNIAYCVKPTDGETVSSSEISAVSTEIDINKSTGETAWDEKLRNTEPGWSWEDIKEPKGSGFDADKTHGSGSDDNVTLEKKATESITQNSVDPVKRTESTSLGPIFSDSEHPQDNEDIVGSDNGLTKLVIKKGDTTRKMFEVGSNASIYKFESMSQNGIPDVDDTDSTSAPKKLVSDAEFATWRKSKSLIVDPAIGSGYDDDQEIGSVWSMSKGAVQNDETGSGVDTIKISGNEKDIFGDVVFTKVGNSYHSHEE